MLELATALYLLLAATGLSLSVSYAGLPVLGQGAFVAVGAVGTALLGPEGAGLPLVPAVAVAVAGAGVLGHVVALGASRLEGAYLALATWALAWLVHRTLLAFPETFGGSQGLPSPSPARLSSDLLGVEVVLTPVWHVALAGVLCVLALAALARVARGPGGLDIAALRSGQLLATSLGVPVAARRRAVLTATATLGGLSGAGSVVLLGVVAPQDVSPLLSLQLFVAVLLGGTARWWGPVLGVAVLTALPRVADVLADAGGLAPERVRGAVTAALLVAVLGVRALLRRRDAPSPDAATPLAATLPVPRGSGWRPVLLRCEDVTASFGAVRALDGVSLSLAGGEVHALVGPNGSGKSTLLAVLAGDLDPGTGTVEAGGAPAPAGTVARVHAGVVRTPQRTVHLPGVAARRQVAVGARGGRPSSGAVMRHLVATPGSRAAARAAGDLVDSTLAECDLTHVGSAPLAVGDQRLLQVARAAATGAQVLLLDEPAAGMTAQERVRLAAVLRRLAGNGRAVLLVEHDMALVGAVADHVTVLEAGRVLASGTPAEVRADPEVRRAYLGEVPA